MLLFIVFVVIMFIYITIQSTNKQSNGSKSSYDSNYNPQKNVSIPSASTPQKHRFKKGQAIVNGMDLSESEGNNGTVLGEIEIDEEERRKTEQAIINFKKKQEERKKKDEEEKVKRENIARQKYEVEVGISHSNNLVLNGDEVKNHWAGLNEQLSQKMIEEANKKEEEFRQKAINTLLKRIESSSGYEKYSLETKLIDLKKKFGMLPIPSNAIEVSLRNPSFIDKRIKGIEQNEGRSYNAYRKIKELETQKNADKAFDERLKAIHEAKMDAGIHSIIDKINQFGFLSNGFGENLRYYHFYRYHPISDEYYATVSDWDIRNKIWGFKTGKQESQDNVIIEVSNFLSGVFTNIELSTMVFICAPASTEYKNTLRFYNFSNELCKKTGMMSGFHHIHIIKDREASHLGGKTNYLANLSFDNEFFKDKRVIIFDDVVTKGRTMCGLALKLKKLGATVILGISIGKTVHYN